MFHDRNEATHVGETGHEIIKHCGVVASVSTVKVKLKVNLQSKKVVSVPDEKKRVWRNSDGRVLSAGW